MTEQFTMIILLIALGYFLKRINFIKATDSQVIATLVLNVTPIFSYCEFKQCRIKIVILHFTNFNDYLWYCGENDCCLVLENMIITCVDQ